MVKLWDVASGKERMTLRHPPHTRAVAFAPDGKSLASGSLGNWLRGNLKFARAQRYFAGSVYIGLGAATAFSGAHRRY